MIAYSIVYTILPHMKYIFVLKCNSRRDKRNYNIPNKITHLSSCVLKKYQSTIHSSSKNNKEKNYKLQSVSLNCDYMPD